MTDTLPPQPWMTDPATVEVMAALAAAGGADCARFVGGCVRNTLMARPVTDIDIATTLTPDEVTAALRAAGLKAVPTGAAHGTITAVAQGRPFEITTLRRDVETDGRRAVVAFTDDWAEDAARRDFRLNALYADRRGRIFDPTGSGLADLRAGAIVFVGDAETRIREDALRILRFFRFLAWYGRGEPDAAALAACEALRDLVTGLSAERVAKELLALLAAEDPRRGGGLDGPDRRPWPSPARRPEAEPLRAPGGNRNRDAVHGRSPVAPGRPAARRSRRRRRRRGAPAALQRPARQADGRPGDGAAPGVVDESAPDAPGRVPPRRPGLLRPGDPGLGGQRSRRGRDAVAGAPAHGANLAKTHPAAHRRGGGRGGRAAGPLVGEVLREVEAWWIDHDFIDDKLSVVERLKAVVQGMVY